MFAVKIDVSPLCIPLGDIEVPPPVGVSGEGMAGIFVQAVVVLVPHDVEDQSTYDDNRPVGLQDREDLACQHVELALACGRS